MAGRYKYIFIFVFLLFAADLSGSPVSEANTAQAQSVSVPPYFCTSPCAWRRGRIPCIYRGATQNAISGTVYPAFYQEMQSTFNSLSDWMNTRFDEFIEAMLVGIDEIIEGGFQDWMDQWWAYDFRPALQAKMGQLNTAYVDQTRAAGSAMDSSLLNAHMQEQSNQQNQARIRYEPSEALCVSGSMAGSFARSNSLNRAFRQARERDQTGAQINKAGSKYENGPAQAALYQWNRYCQNLVDPTNNDGATGCPAGMTLPPEETRNADIEPGRFLFNNLTIDVRNPNEAAALEALIENLTGILPQAPQPESSFETLAGRDRWLDKRSFAARKNAARSPIEYIASQRLPTSNIGDLVEALRTDAGIPLSGLSENPSYKEILHAVSTEKFTSGRYNMDNIDTMENMERESLVLSVFYLIQLREYYELLERGLLALAVQTSIDMDTQMARRGGLVGAPTSQ